MRPGSGAKHYWVFSKLSCFKTSFLGAQSCSKSTFQYWGKKWPKTI